LHSASVFSKGMIISSLHNGKAIRIMDGKCKREVDCLNLS